MYIALIKVVPAVIRPYVNLGGDGSVLGESFALYPSILGCSPMQSWLLPIYLPILGCLPLVSPKGVEFWSQGMRPWWEWVEGPAPLVTISVCSLHF